MILKRRIQFNWLQVTVFFYLVHLAMSDLEAGSCSESCQNRTLVASKAQNETSSTRLTTEHCSCTLSCKVYNDCCYDSQFRNTAHNISTRTICLSLLSRGQFKAVASCSSKWKGYDNFCSHRIGFLPPVTSKSSGVTYVNIYCAICNKDANDLVIWNVDLKCCPEHDDDTENILERRFVYEDGYLQSVVPRTVGSSRKCLCKYHACEGDYSFLDSLELRACESNTEISRCSSTWENETTRDLCTSFREPVYARHKIYKNLYCAQCNYENLNLVQCLPNIFRKMVEEGVDEFTLYNHCLENNLQDCLQFFGATGRGRLRPFSRLFNINVQECVPPRGRHCCAGYRYDFSAKICRKLD